VPLHDLNKDSVITINWLRDALSKTYCVRGQANHIAIENLWDCYTVLYTNTIVHTRHLTKLSRHVQRVNFG
jgi:hypothetical protein